MLIVLLNWIYVFVTCFIVGNFVLLRIMKNRKCDVSSKIVAGMAVITAYAGYFSLFLGVGVCANIVLCVCCVLLLIVDKKYYTTGIKTLLLLLGQKRKVKDYLYTVISIVVALMVVIFTASGRFAYDTGLYHAQSIRWIEEFGVVKGLAYMQTRLGFNSSYFCLCALYSFSDISNSLHTLSGFLGTLVMLHAINGIKKHFRFFYLAPFAYFVITAFEIISPTTDFATIWFVLFLFTKWVELIIENQGIREFDYESMQPAPADDIYEIRPFTYLCVFAVFLLTIKLSAAFLVLLAVKPAVDLIRKKRFKDIILLIVSALILIIPYFVRNVIITGWLIYPLPGIDLFNFDWKIPLSGVEYEADEIVVWARYTKDAKLINQSFGEWVPVWWREQGSGNRWLTLSMLLGIVLFIIKLFMSFALKISLYIRKKHGEFVIVSPNMRFYNEMTYFECAVLLNIAFWFIKAPSNRFGYGYILFLPLLLLTDVGYAFETEIFKEKISNMIRLFFSACCCFVVLVTMLKGLGYFAISDIDVIRNTEIEDYIVCQKDYEKCDYSTKEWEGMNLSFPNEEGAQIWYDAFPAILYESNLDGIERRGPKIRDGFRLLKEN